VAYSGDGAHAYVVNEADNSVSVLEPAARTVAATVNVGRAPQAVAVAADGRFAYVTNRDDGTVSVLRLSQP
jgi:YVTN family beta-propeller protein